jgi:putative membrane protein
MLLRVLNTALLLIWIAFLSWLLTFGKNDLIRLLHPRLWWILGFALVVLSLFVVSLITGRGQSAKKSLLVELPGIAILLVPVFYFTIATDAKLDEASLHNRVIQDEDGFFLNNLPPLELFGESEFSNMTFSEILRAPEKYENQDVEVVCQSFVNDDLPENVAMCYRYLITCCAADALPVFFFLMHDDELEIENNRWIRVGGKFSTFSNNDMEFPSITVAGVEYVKEPTFPWAI